MASAIIYLDESGDLGWSLNQPYRNGGSSRYLTISALIVPTDQAHLPVRLMKDLYSSRKWKVGNEKKWGQMIDSARLDFASRAGELRKANSEIHYVARTVKKENVSPHIRLDSNKLYNFMIKLMLLDRMAQYQHVTLVPDPRSIKVESGNSLHDYLQTELWFTKIAATVLESKPEDSANCLGLQFADMLAGAVFRYHEDNDSAPMNILSPHIHSKRLFF
jgi:hypothetical protein